MTYFSFLALVLCNLIVATVHASWDGPVVTVEREEKIPQNHPIAAQEDEIEHNRIAPSYRTDERADGSLAHHLLVSSTITSANKAANEKPMFISVFMSIAFLWCIV